ncbi:hypothetical protein Q765_03165 [Flavobacterium rivuli WB 3.3-2 = DSM 21788]|uniref:Uncharacterized protein n=1 Tax=Flavobacterium rivuli WB 3.3-2 = DSM 21788 TaxID=1121895 RepID=A0A0A2MIB8_9FLAO|nr:hypothetical protein [Flavobacterium rivuli]KGO88070.1 hypothetical protein Q765_03165 [Flavobacterium rivuli WB 3.3-2 = DSM 21788]
MLKNLNLSGSDKERLKKTLQLDENYIQNSPQKTYGYSMKMLDVQAMLKVVCFMATKLHHDDVEDEYKEDMLWGIDAITRSAIHLLPTMDEGDILDEIHKEVYRAKE